MEILQCHAKTNAVKATDKLELRLLRVRHKFPPQTKRSITMIVPNIILLEPVKGVEPHLMIYKFFSVHFHRIPWSVIGLYLLHFPEAAVTP